MWRLTAAISDLRDQMANIMQARRELMCPRSWLPRNETNPIREALAGSLYSLGGVAVERVDRSQLRSGVGLTTRVVAVELLSHLIERHPNEVGVADDGADCGGAPPPPEAVYPARAFSARPSVCP